MTPAPDRPEAPMVPMVLAEPPVPNAPPVPAAPPVPVAPPVPAAPVVPAGLAVPSARVVLVGTGEYTRPDRGMTRIPVVSATLTRMQEAFTTFFGAAAVGDPVENPVDRQAVLDRIGDAVAADHDLVVFYYVGHGLRDRSPNLYLGLQESEDDDDHRRRETSLAVDDVFAVLRTAPSSCRVVVVLDCCFARSAFDAPHGADFHLLVATDRTRKARFDVDGAYTAFSGELLRLLGEGVPDGPDSLDLATVYRHVDVALRVRGLPAPHQRAVDSSAAVVLGRNPAFGTATTPAGLRSRARFADRTGRVGDAAQAARLFAGVVADAALVALPGEALPGETLPGETLFDFRHAHAVWVSQAGDRPRASHLLDALLADPPRMAAPARHGRIEQARHNLELVRART